MSEYQVLARKYRPKKLSELVGQDVLVKTLSSAIKQNRIPHAFVLTGIRGVGKTSTARIIARSLLCTGKDNDNKEPTVEPCGICPNCQGIQNDNHVDVIEVDAASRTGVNDIREIIDQVSYAPVMGRLKIYIIDEVHMLSKSAFNALLKTLEEPPPHVKFIFATTEVRKIPVTILSRCMRFDLPRVSLEKLNEHFKNISKSEGVKVDDDAIKIIAAAAEGSVRDGLSLLDQSMAITGGQEVSAEKVREMLGLADKDQTYNLISLIIDSKFEEALKELNNVYNKGTDPVLIIKDLLEITHMLTLAKTSEKILEQNFISELEKNKSKEILAKTSIAELTRLWQILSKGIEESRYCPSPLMAAEMILIRACYASSLPTPSEIIGKLDGGSSGGEQPKPKVKEEQPAPQETLFAEKKTLNSPTPPQPAQQEVKITAAPTVERSPSYSGATASAGASVARGAPALKTITNENPIAHQVSLGLSVPRDFKEMVTLFLTQKEKLIATWLESVKVINYDAEAGVIKILAEATPSYINVKEITKKLNDWTGKRFIFSLENAANTNARSINDDRQEELEKRKNEAINSPAVQAILKEFAGSKITKVDEIFE